MARYSILIGLLVITVGFVLAAPADAHGDKIIPQVADGTGSDGTQFRTKFDITNLGPYQAQQITKLSILFYHQNGSPWLMPYRLGGTQGNASEIPLTLDAFQTVRIETLGTSAGLQSGYAIVRDLDKTSYFPEDYEPGITVYYEVLQGGRVIDTVSVPLGLPTYAFMVPVETAASQNLFSGVALVNLASASNRVTLELYKAQPPRDTNGLALPDQTVDLNMNASEQTTGFIGSSFFPSATSFKGMLFGRSDGPVAVLALLQTPTPTGVQYATLVPTYRDYLRRNTFMYMQQGYPLDADLLISDYFLVTDDKDPWDLLYRTVDTTHREFAPQEGARFAVIGMVATNDEFDVIGIQTLRALTYTTDSISMSDGSSNLQQGFTFAIRTGLGRYAKLRIYGIIQVGTERDLQLQIYTFR
jgi:hypothetical protein